MGSIPTSNSMEGTATRIFGFGLETASHFSSIGGFLLAATATAPLAFGLVPRAGPLRALVLGLKSFVFRPTITRSNRVAEIALLEKRLSSLKGGKFLVGVGGKGVGKTTLIDTVLYGKFGVLTVIVEPGMMSEQIKGAVYSKITRSSVAFQWLNLEESALRVIKWHRRFFLGQPPIVVLQVGERGANEPAAKVAHAVRTLALQGLRVVVDSSYNSLDALALNTERERPVYVEPMDLGMLVTIPEISDLVTALKKAGDFDLAFAVLGGVPLKWVNLAEAWGDAGMQDIKGVTEAFLTATLASASEHVKNARIANAHWAGVYAHFKEADEVPLDVLEGLGPEPAATPTSTEEAAKVRPEKVLRRVYKPSAKQKVLVPTTAALRLVLRYGENGDPPSLDEIREVLRESAPAKVAAAEPKVA